MRLISAGSLVRAQSGPVFARIVEESEDCRAVAGAKADRVELGDVNVASYDSASQAAECATSFTSIFFKAASIQGAYTPPDAARGASKPQSPSDQKQRLER